MLYLKEYKNMLLVLKNMVDRSGDIVVFMSAYMVKLGSISRIFVWN